MKNTLIILTALILNNCVLNNEPEQQNGLESKTEQNGKVIEEVRHYNIDDYESITIIDIPENVFSYSISISIFDYKGGGPSTKRIQAFTGSGSLEGCFDREENALIVHTGCIWEFFTDYADPTDLIITRYSTNNQ